MSIEEKVAAWLNSDDSLTERGAAIRDDVVEEAKRLRTMLYASLPDSLKAMGLNVFRIGEPVLRGGGYDVDITVDPALVHRDSLVPGQYPEGVENIIANFNVGWSTRLTPSGNRHRMVKGMWHGEPHWSRPVYPRPGRNDSVHFLEDAISAFVASSSFNPKVYLNTKYTTRNETGNTSVEI